MQHALDSVFWVTSL